MRPIDADKLLMKEHQYYNYLADEWFVPVRDIEDAPTVDAVEVVRCKNCKWASYDCEWCLNPDAPVGGDDATHLYIEPNWYCADGKRRENTDGETD